MAKRYGRNQRRKHREEIETLRANVAAWQGKAVTANFQLNRAKEEAFDMLMRDTGRIDAITERLTVELTRKFGEELMPVVQQIVASEKRPRKKIDFSASVPYDQSTEVLHIRGVIPELHYNFALEKY